MSDIDPEPGAARTEPGTGAGGDDRSGLDRITGVGARLGNSLLMPTLALITALVMGAVVIALTDIDTLRLWPGDPGQALSDTISQVSDAYSALYRGSIGSWDAIAETLFAATPLILAGLAVAIAFQAGLFNIGANGQMHIGGMAALWVGFTVDAPSPILIPLCLLAAIVGGGIWGAIPGALKARTGAHEVITTIMFNFIALSLVSYLLTTSWFQAEGRNDPISEPAGESARLPPLVGSDHRLHIGFLIALVAVGFTHWLLYHSKLGFELRTVGANPDAARYAGIRPLLSYVIVMAIAGAMAGLAGANQLLGLEPYRAQGNFAGNTGFDAIAISLLGRSQPFGVLWASILFGGLRAGGRQMQAAADVPLDLVIVIQALIIVFIAAPAVIRAIYRLPDSVGTGDAEAAHLTGGWGG